MDHTCTDRNRELGNTKVCYFGLKTIIRPLDFSFTECVTDLDLQNEIIIFQSLLTTFETSFIVRGSWNCSKDWLEPKTKPQ